MRCCCLTVSGRRSIAVAIGCRCWRASHCPWLLGRSWRSSARAIRARRRCCGSRRAACRPTGVLSGSAISSLTGLSDRRLARVLRTEVGWAARTGPEVRVRVRDYVELPLATGRWLGWRERRRRVTKVLKQLDVAGCAELRWGELSDWQRALVELAQAVVSRPRVLLLDDVIDGLGLGQEAGRDGHLARLSRTTSAAVC